LTLSTNGSKRPDPALTEIQLAFASEIIVRLQISGV
jgi:hypothetical protein